jgi:hypothetical protein
MNDRNKPQPPQEQPSPHPSERLWIFKEDLKKLKEWRFPPKIELLFLIFMAMLWGVVAIKIIIDGVKF